MCVGVQECVYTYVCEGVWERVSTCEYVCVSVRTDLHLDRPGHTVGSRVDTVTKENRHPHRQNSVLNRV